MDKLSVLLDQLYILCGERLSERFCMWRKLDKYHVCIVIFYKSLSNKLCRCIWKSNTLHQNIGQQVTLMNFSNNLNLFVSIHFTRQQIIWIFSHLFFGCFWSQAKVFWALISVASLEHCNEVSAEFFCPVKMCFEFAREANFRWI